MRFGCIDADDLTEPAHPYQSPRSQTSARSNGSTGRRKPSVVTAALLGEMDVNARTPRRTRIEMGTNPLAEANKRIRAEHERARNCRDEDWNRDIVRRTKEATRELEDDAARLESLLREGRVSS